jgi:beta-N-acetylhexosaminidase
MALIGLFLLAFSSSMVPKDFQRPGPVHLDHKGEKWAQSTLKKLSLEEKIGQMFMIRVTMPQFVNIRNPEYLKWLDEISRYHVGSILVTVVADGPMLAKGEPYESAAVINDLQHASKIPLLVAADYERGLSMRMNGVTIFPHSMAFGAAGKPELAEQFGRIAGEESRAVGVNWNLMPVADVNSNPANPVINTRSFGENPATVSDLVSAFIRGSHSAGVLTSVKHFPGHGDTATDSHLGVATVNRTREQVEQIDLPPFRAAIAAGTDSVMIAHVTVPSIEPQPGKVATNSSTIVTNVLRHELGFKGLIVTDAMEMAGLTQIYSEGGPAAMKRAAIDIVEAGNDMLMLPSDLDSAYNGLVEAVRSGRIPERRIDESVLKILEAKASVGLNHASQVDLNKLSTVIASPENLTIAQQIADSAITLVRENGRMLPLKRRSASPANGGAAQIEGGHLLCVIFVNDVRSDDGRQLQRELRARAPNARFIFVDSRIAEGSADEIQKAVASADNVIAAIYLSPVPGRVVAREGGVARNTISMPESTGALLQSILQAKPAQTTVVSLGSPYMLEDFPAIQNYVCSYSNVPPAEAAVVKALFGEIPFHGRLPVTIPGQAQRGAGMDAAQPSQATARTEK